MRFRPSVASREEQLSSLPGVHSVERHGNRITVTGAGDLLGTVIAALARDHIVAEELRVDHASLEDAFVSLTSHSNGRQEDTCPR